MKNNSLILRAKQSLSSLVQAGQFQVATETANHLRLIKEKDVTFSCFGLVVKPQ